MTDTRVGGIDRFEAKKIFSSGARPVITKWRKKNTARHYWRSGSGSVREHRGLGREMAARELVEKREEK